MSRFRPVRASPPPKSSAIPAATLAKDLDNSRSSTISVPELVDLSPEEVDFIDAVIERAPASATTFLTVFKAYNDLLQERGLDPQNEVVYYGKLLKLGTLRGKNWGEKWAMIKQQQGYVVGAGGARRTTRVTRAAPASTRISTRLTAGINNVRPEDTLTLHSHPEDADVAPESPVTALQYHHIPQATRPPISPTFTTTTTNSLGLDTGIPAASYNPRRAFASRPTPTRQLGHWDAETSEATGDSAHAPSTIPPSYGAAMRDVVPPRHIALAKLPLSRTASASPPSIQPIALRRLVPRGKERRDSVVNEEDAWSKIKMAQDEQDADRFRDERLLERCWDVWRQGYQWIITTHEQITEARDHLILRIALQRWRERTAEHHELYKRVYELSNNRRLKLALHVWKTKLKEKKQANWRNDMRAKMKTVRENHETKLVKDAWAKWRQSYQSHLSGQQYSEKLVIRFLRRWKLRLGSLDQLDAAADHFIYAKEVEQVSKCWDMWRCTMEVRKAERTITERVGLRVMGDVMDVWRGRLHDNRVADGFYDVIVVKRALGAWKAARDRIRTLESRASKHLARQNDVLVRAVMRVWKAHERGKLLDRVRTARLLKQAVAVWKRRVRQQRELEDLAVAFSMRSSSTLAFSSLQKWRQVHTTHRNAHAFAVHYRSAQLQYKMLLVWRLELRTKLRMIKQAKLANKYFVLRTFYNKWAAKLVQRRLETKLKVFEGQIVKKFLEEWQKATQRQQQRKLAEMIIQQRIALRILSGALTHWTNHVANIKFRELETTQKVESTILANAFKKWKGLCIRHVEELSLMESYQDVKREENMRRMFYRWLTAARKVRHRRLYLQEKEEEMKLTVVAAAWDKWRERFQDIRLQPVADDFLMQKETNTMFRAFGIWHSKTKSLPAVRFHASRAKAKAWQIWRDAMPRALQARTARDMDRRSVLAQTFDKWLKTYKTKIELKAVARARYLRLPTAAPRQVIENPRFTMGTQPPRSVFPRTLRSSSPGKDPSNAAAGPSIGCPRPGKTGIVSLLTSKLRSPERSERRLTRTRASISPSRPKLSTRGTTTRDPSPTRAESSYGGGMRDDERPARSVASGPSVGEAARSSLWQELREIRLRAGTLSERSRFREPP
ncbi:hypothetical protein SCP_0407250 [Sparassis crispa]|uniref:Sfi1 spindle body domain-containing protein n=1 Tax=Sparassis crispa TaxID=139825 RepID=A0A401GJK4_9APHY|nr:hypothetical protein SCP_0407250 [Sparassis crispa]GBE82341.1 hypothetical protein SCP_0407250 [Sparassis crispa]